MELHSHQKMVVLSVISCQLSVVGYQAGRIVINEFGSVPLAEALEARYFYLSLFFALYSLF